jgi:hypothetical protein
VSSSETGIWKIKIYKEIRVCVVILVTLHLRWQDSTETTTMIDIAQALSSIGRLTPRKPSICAYSSRSDH